MTESWARVSLRFATGAIGRSEISTLIGLSPSPFKGRPGALATWILECPGAPSEPLEKQLAWVQRVISSRTSSIKSVLERTDGDIFVGWTPRLPQDTLVLESSMCWILGELGLDIVMDVYPSEKDE